MLQMQKRRETMLEVAATNSQILAHHADFESAGKFVKLLAKIPKFQLKLTHEEEELIGKPGNVLAIGRSGTGKTTCAVLRLLAQETLFTLKILQNKKIQGLL
jgi:polynucleotide 5'-kinase involved in rRNA processing